MDKDAFQDQLKRDGYGEIEIGEVAADVRRAEHAHAFDVSALVLSGAITLTRAGEARTYRPGDSFDMAAGTMHAEDIGPEGVRYLVGRRH